MSTFATVRRALQAIVQPRPAPPPPPARRRAPAIDAFTPAPAQPARPTPPVIPLTRAEDRATATASYQARLERAPSADETAKAVTFLETLRAQGKSLEERRAAMEFVIAMTPEWQAKDTYRTSLGREPSADELAKLTQFGSQLAAEGKSVGDVRAAMNFVTAMSPEWQAKETYRASLGREPNADELTKLTQFGTQLQAEGKSVAEMRGAMDFVTAMSPEWQAKDTYRASLGREPNADELMKLTQFGTQLQAEGKSVEELRAAMNFVTALTPEWQAKDAYRTHLGREPNGDELTRMIAFGAELQGQGKSVGDLRAAFDFVIGLSPEFQARHPRLTTDRDALYLQQPNGWSCGPTSLAMALAATGARPANQDTVWELVGALGARAGVGTPGGVSLIADVARRFGVNAEANGSREPGDVRAALERGHGAVVNGDLGGGGHFIYLSGLDEAGNYIVCDPWRPQITRWTDADLWAFTHHGNNPPGFAEIWPA